MLIADDPVHAFVPYPGIAVDHAETGPLSGLTFAVKDIFDLAGYRTGGGCPTLLAMSEPAQTTAPAIRALLDAGGHCLGKTHTDELAWSLYGMNAHFGTPINAAARDRIPGGSSSGSAAAVAAGLVDFAVGTDTGGSVRAPASFCGLWGLRPTHGRVSLAGCLELAAGFDTAGAFARDGVLLGRVMETLGGRDPAPLGEQVRLLRPIDMIERLGAAQHAIYDRLFASLATDEVQVYPEGGADALYEAFRILQGWEARSSVLPFIRRSGMPLAAGLDERAAAAEALTQADHEKAATRREDFRTAMDRLLGVDGVLLAPAVHDAPFHRDAGREVFNAYRHDAMKLLCVAGLAGLPQVVFPAGTVEAAPFGLSLIGPRGSDLSLIALAVRLANPPGGANSTFDSRLMSDR